MKNIEMLQAATALVAVKQAAAYTPRPGAQPSPAVQQAYKQFDQAVKPKRTFMDKIPYFIPGFNIPYAIGRWQQGSRDKRRVEALKQSIPTLAADWMRGMPTWQRMRMGAGVAFKPEAVAGKIEQLGQQFSQYR